MLVLPLSLRWLFRFDHENLFALVVAAVWADVMRQARLVAVGAGSQVACREREMTAPTIAAPFGQFAFR